LEFWLLKFELNSNLIYICVWRTLSNLHLMSALWGEMKVTARMPHAGKQSINSAVSHVALYLPSIDVCSVSGPPRFVTLIACISIQHVPGAQCQRESERHGGMQGGEGRRGVSKRGGRRLNWRPAENKEIVTQCTAEVTELHFQGKTVFI